MARKSSPDSDPAAWIEDLPDDELHRLPCRRPRLWEFRHFVIVTVCGRAPETSCRRLERREMAVAHLTRLWLSMNRHHQLPRAQTMKVQFWRNSKSGQLKYVVPQKTGNGAYSRGASSCVGEW